MDQMHSNAILGQNVSMIFLYVMVITPARIIQMKRIVQKFGVCPTSSSV